LFGNKVKTFPSRIDSLIAFGTRIEGDIEFTGGLRIEGKVIGNIRISNGDSGTLMVGPKASVQGNIEVEHLLLDGTITGDIHARQSVELRPASRVVGDVSYRSIELQLGATVNGRLAPLDDHVIEN